MKELSYFVNEQAKLHLVGHTFRRIWPVGRPYQPEVQGPSGPALEWAPKTLCVFVYQKVHLTWISEITTLQIIRAEITNWQHLLNFRNNYLTPVDSETNRLFPHDFESNHIVDALHQIEQASE